MGVVASGSGALAISMNGVGAAVPPGVGELVGADTEVGSQGVSGSHAGADAGPLPADPGVRHQRRCRGSGAADRTLRWAGVGVAPRHASRTVRNARRAAVVGSRDLGTEGILSSPGAGFHSTCCLYLSFLFLYLSGG